ncbi:GT4 family glycosyltransferase PelF [Acidiferrobacter sp.]|uniref:GT4 family glycosyltransferase PelF n=1 Tax=Acidiferrobacter sp. TaxID=1872107 RepID=UPI002610DA2D|nr:GT4 family glycosyltransferase PelF [Acidiferrobacter sp.]
MTQPFPKADSVDIMLLLEGTFPYVSGGVSSWVNQLIKGLPHYRFGIVFLGSRPQDYGAVKYPFPENLVHLEAHYLFTPADAPPPKPPQRQKGTIPCLHDLHARLRQKTRPFLPDSLRDLGFYTNAKGGIPLEEFLYGEDSWTHITKTYEERCTDPSFVDYFWTVRNMHLPIWHLAAVARQLIPARCYHAVSTGYAGLLGTLLRWHTGRPLLLSEHGIYTKERRIDLLNAAWIADRRSRLERDPSEISYLRELWIAFFESLGRACYEAAFKVVALYPDAQGRQIADGADKAQTLIIPNGVPIAPFAAIRAPRIESSFAAPILCLLGRVTPIKDIKTFIRAMRAVINDIPQAQGWIVGPEDEDPAYVAECRSLIDNLDLAGHVRFLGFRPVTDILPQVHLLVLSSISEGLPLVLLEGFAAGVPAVCTDVGACRRLIFGSEDDSLGAAGDITGIADPQALAHAAIGLLTSRERWHAAQTAAIARVETHYTDTRMFERYETLYREAHNA